ncbi:MAG: hypothetical protein ACLTSZ_19750 [Lachnospiraceae bacterium]
MSGGERHCPSKKAFQKERHGTIERLNKCWSTTYFWSHTTEL